MHAYYAPMASKPDLLMPALWEIASQLRRMRDEAGLSASELGMRINKSQSHVSRWEAAKIAPTETDVAAICDALGIGPERRSRLTMLCTRAHGKNAHKSAGNPRLAQMIAFEDQAASMVQLAPMLIPGILHSPGYARAIISAGDLSDQEVDRRVALRMKRQEMLVANGTRFEALIAQWALEAPPCMPDVMHDQVKHILMLQDQADIIVRRVPMGGSYSGMYGGSILMMRFNKMSPLAYLEVHDYSTLITERRDLVGLEHAVSVCRQRSDSPEDTRRALEAMTRL